MDAESFGIAISLLGLTVLLVVLTVRAVARFFETKSRPQLMWGGGLGLAAAAMAVESVVYFGVVTSGILQT